MSVFKSENRWTSIEQKAGAWASILGLIALVFGLASPLPLAVSIKEIIYACGLVSIATGSLATFAVATTRMSRKARYAEAIVSVRESVSKIVAEGQYEYHDLAERRRVIATAMEALSSAFSIITGSNCRCCVKHIELRDGNFFAKTFCRSSANQSGDKPHPIDHNTDFSELFHDPNKLWFFGNDLSGMATKGKYTNTAPEWSSRYMSTLVWAIRCEILENDESPDLLGFLCVDSRRKNPFSIEYDHPIGALVADALGPFMMIVAASLKEAVSPTADLAGPLNVVAAPVNEVPLTLPLVAACAAPEPIAKPASRQRPKTKVDP